MEWFRSNGEEALFKTRFAKEAFPALARAPSMAFLTSDLRPR
jgi:hypothetical protein